MGIPTAESSRSLKTRKGSAKPPSAKKPQKRGGSRQGPTAEVLGGLGKGLPIYKSAINVEPVVDNCRLVAEPPTKVPGGMVLPKGNCDETGDQKEEQNLAVRHFSRREKSQGMEDNKRQKSLNDAAVRLRSNGLVKVANLTASPELTKEESRGGVCENKARTP